MPGWMNQKLELRIARENINHLRYAESEEELNSLMMKVKEETKKWA